MHEPNVARRETLDPRSLESPIGVLPNPPQNDLRVVFTQLCVVQFDALMCAAASPVHAWVPLNPSPALRALTDRADLRVTQRGCLHPIHVGPARIVTNGNFARVRTKLSPTCYRSTLAHLPFRQAAKHLFVSMPHAGCCTLRLLEGALQSDIITTRCMTYLVVADQRWCMMLLPL